MVLAFVERLAEREELDLEACGEFLVLVAALPCSRRAPCSPVRTSTWRISIRRRRPPRSSRSGWPSTGGSGGCGLARGAAGRRARRFFRVGPAPLAPQPERRLAPQDAAGLAGALRALAVEPPAVSLAHLELRFPPVEQFLGCFRALLARRTRFDFDTEVEG